MKKLNVKLNNNWLCNKYYNQIEYNQILIAASFQINFKPVDGKTNLIRVS